MGKVDETIHYHIGVQAFDSDENPVGEAIDIPAIEIGPLLSLVGANLRERIDIDQRLDEIVKNISPANATPDQVEYVERLLNFRDTHQRIAGALLDVVKHHSVDPDDLNPAISNEIEEILKGLEDSGS